jgi:hypothetical protein
MTAWHNYRAAHLPNLRLIWAFGLLEAEWKRYQRRGTAARPNH